MFLDRSIEIASRLPVLADTLVTPTRLAASELALIVGGGKGAAAGCALVEGFGVGLGLAGFFGCPPCGVVGGAITIGTFFLC